MRVYGMTVECVSCIVQPGIEPDPEAAVGAVPTQLLRYHNNTTLMMK